MVESKSITREELFKARHTGFELIGGTYGPSIEANVSKSPSGPTSTSLWKNLAPSFSLELIYIGICQYFGALR